MTHRPSDYETPEAEILARQDATRILLGLEVRKLDLERYLKSHPEDAEMKTELGLVVSEIESTKADYMRRGWL